MKLILLTCESFWDLLFINIFFSHCHFWAMAKKMGIWFFYLSDIMHFLFNPTIHIPTLNHWNTCVYRVCIPIKPLQDNMFLYHLPHFTSVRTKKKNDHRDILYHCKEAHLLLYNNEHPTQENGIRRIQAVERFAKPTILHGETGTFTCR